jgi:ubiquinone/menaquinone biosynthesis C-methylase UbiE
MEDIIWATPLYKFLRLCNASLLEKKVLDCGAGGREPPLSIFYHSGYQVLGLEIDPVALAQAYEYCRQNEMQLNIINGDMRRTPLPAAAVNFIFSYNAVFFMNKVDIEVTINEFNRLLPSGGLCFVNFMSVDDPEDRPFCDSSPFQQMLGSKQFAKHEDNEADSYFNNFEIQCKEKRFVERKSRTGWLKQVTLEYIVEKK